MYKEIFVLGDSHSRSFSYHSGIKCLFIGPGISNCFLDKKKAAFTKHKILANLQRIDTNNVITFVLGEPDIRHYLISVNKYDTNVKNITEEDIEHVKNSALYYSNVIDEILPYVKGKLVIYSTVPTERKNHNILASIYNCILKEHCINKGVHFFDCWEYAYDFETDVVKKSFQADYVHMNDKILPYFLQYLISNKLISNIYENNLISDIEWNYLYKLNVKDFETRMWGDYSLKKLRKYENYDFNFPLTTITNEILSYLQVIFFFLRLQKKYQEILLLDCKEGYVAFRLNNIISISVDVNKILISRARFISTYTGSKHNFMLSEEYLKVKKDMNSAVCIYPNSYNRLDSLFKEYASRISHRIFLIVEEPDVKQLSINYPEFHVSHLPCSFNYNNKKYKLCVFNKKQLMFYEKYIFSFLVLIVKVKNKFKLTFHSFGVSFKKYLKKCSQFTN